MSKNLYKNQNYRIFFLSFFLRERLENYIKDFIIKCTFKILRYPKNYQVTVK